MRSYTMLKGFAAVVLVVSATALAVPLGTHEDKPVDTETGPLYTTDASDE